MVELDPDLVKEVSPLILPSLHPVGETKGETIKRKRTATNGRPSCHPVGEEHSDRRSAEGGHLIVGGGTPKPSGQPSRDNLSKIVRSLADGFRESHTAREVRLPRRRRSGRKISYGGGWSRGVRNGLREGGRMVSGGLGGWSHSVRRGLHGAGLRCPSKAAEPGRMAGSHAEKTASWLRTASSEMAPHETPETTAFERRVEEINRRMERKG